MLSVGGSGLCVLGCLKVKLSDTAGNGSYIRFAVDCGCDVPSSFSACLDFLKNGGQECGTVTQILTSHLPCCAFSQGFFCHSNGSETGILGSPSPSGLGWGRQINKDIPQNSTTSSAA